MKKLLLILFIYLGLIGSANAISSTGEFYTTTCSSEQSTGFAWENNDWKKVSFKTNQYEVIKVDPTKIEYPYQCSKSIDKDNIYKYYYESDNSLWQSGCYLIKDLGAKDNLLRTECNEQWSTYKKEDGELIPKTRELKAVMCENKDFNFSPDGWFHTGYVTNHLDPIADDYKKDVLFVEVGKCSTGNFKSNKIAPSLDSHWQELKKDARGSAYYLALDSIKKIDGYVNYWYMRDYADNEKMGPIRSEKILVQGDCSAQRINRISYHLFKKPKGIDIEMSFDTESPEWLNLKPETIGKFVLNLSCSLEEEMRPMSFLEQKEFIGQIKKL